jgi:hypothetical protein
MAIIASGHHGERLEAPTYQRIIVCVKSARRQFGRQLASAMTDIRDPTDTIIIQWLVSIWTGVVYDKRRVGDVRLELLDVAYSVQDIGRHELADKIKAAVKEVRPEAPDVAIQKLLDDLGPGLSNLGRGRSRHDASVC